MRINKKKTNYRELINADIEREGFYKGKPVIITTIRESLKRTGSIDGVLAGLGAGEFIIS